MQSYLDSGYLLKTAYEISPKIDLGIEGMRSQQFSEGVFFFMLIGILVFCAIIVALMLRRRQQQSPAKRGETIMFGAIIVGVVGAVIYGAMQMLGGYLF